MYCHLVTVEVGVECCTNQRVKLNGLALNQNRFKGLDAEAVQGWSAVEHNRVFLDNLLQHVPYLGTLFLHHLLGTLDGSDQSTFFKLVVDKRFKQFKRHLFGKTAL